LFDNRAQGWAKSKADERRIQTKDEVAAAVMKQDAEKRNMAQGDRDAPNSRGQRNDRDDYRGDRQKDRKGGKDWNSKNEPQQKYRAREGQQTQTPKGGNKRYNNESDEPSLKKKYSEKASKA
jgi:hypothetical protein